LKYEELEVNWSKDSKWTNSKIDQKLRDQKHI